MKFVETGLPGVIEIHPDVHGDDRGFFLETYQQRKYEAGGITATFVQDNHSRSRYGVLRGLHMQLAHPQGKLVRVVAGEVFDVAVDVRKGSPTFGQYASVTLSAGNFKQFWVPPGFAHGFAVTSEVAEFEYKCTDFYYPEDEFVIAWNDPDLAIAWPIAEPTLSERDATAVSLRDAMDRLPSYRPEPGGSPGER